MIRLFFFLINHSYFGDVSIGNYLYLAFQGLRFDLSVIFSINLPYLFLALLPLPFVSRTWYLQILNILFLFTNSLGFLFDLADIGYFPYVRKRMTAEVFHLIGKNQPLLRRELTNTLIKEGLEKLQADKPCLATMNLLCVYEALQQCNGYVRNELTTIVSLIRKISGLDANLAAYDRTVDKNFQDWVFKSQEGATQFNDEQMKWLRIIKEYVVNSFHVDKENFRAYGSGWKGRCALVDGLKSILTR